MSELYDMRLYLNGAVVFFLRDMDQARQAQG